MKKKIILGGIVLIVVLVGYFGYLALQLNSLGECGMSVGPIYGEPITVNMADLKLDQQIVIPKGTLGLMNLSDSRSPKLMKFDVHGKIIWAVEFREDSNVGIPHNRLSEMKLVNDKYGIRLEFFNYSYGEPGRVYLTEDYEVKYMCLSPM